MRLMAGFTGLIASALALMPVQAEVVESKPDASFLKRAQLQQ